MWPCQVFFILMIRPSPDFFFFFFNDTATTEIYTLSLHDALPISNYPASRREWPGVCSVSPSSLVQDRKSTRLNSSHSQISYAVFCLKKKTSPTLTISSTRSLGLFKTNLAVDDTQPDRLPFRFTPV